MIVLFCVVVFPQSFLKIPVTLVAAGHVSARFSADPRKKIEGRGTMVTFLSSLNLSTEPSRESKLSIAWRGKDY